jgi:heat shock protein HslJ
MRESWVDELLADAVLPRPEFREQLRDRVLDAWRGRALVDVAERPPQRRRVWPLLAGAAAALAVLVAGLVVLGGSDQPPGQVPSDTSASTTVSTPGDVVGVWVVTEFDGVPIASPLPTYRFSADGTVSGFDGCNRVATTWSLEAGQLRFGETYTTLITCEDSDGTPLPTVAPGGARIETIDGTVTMLFDREAATARARRVGDLEHPARLRGTTWTLGVDGPDVRLRFGDDLTAGVDDVDDCGRTSYTYQDGSLQLGRLEGAGTACVGTHLSDFDTVQTVVVNYTDAYSPSILLVPPTGGAIRLVPGAAVEETVEATPPVSVTIDDLNGRTFLIDSLRVGGDPQDVLAHPIIVFDLNNVWVEAGCNTMHTVEPYALRGNRLVVGQVEMSSLPCPPGDLVDQEQALYRLFSNDPTVTAPDAKTLWLEGAGVQVTAVDTNTLDHPVRTTVPFTTTTY